MSKVAAVARFLVLVGLAVPLPVTAGDYHNFLLCRDGKPECDFAILTLDETNVVAAAARQRQFQACVEESPTCDLAALTAEQRKELPVAQKEQRQARLAPVLESARNLSACIYRTPVCKPTLLTTDQRAKIRAYAAEQAAVQEQLAVATPPI